MTQAPLEHLPVFLRLADRPVVIVGGGVVAARKAELLLRAGARLTVIAPELHAELRTLLHAQHGARYLAQRFEPAHLDAAALVIAATQDSEVNTAVAVAARERNIPCNVVDDGAASTFVFPAIIDRSPVVVAIGSGGHAPVLARRIRAQIESLLPAGIGALARFAGERRARVREQLRPSQRRRFWERIFGGAVAARVLDGQQALADAAFNRELTSFGNTPRTVGEVFLIGAGPGDPDLLTLRALQLLHQADVVLYDRLVSPGVLERARRDAERVFVGKEAGDVQMTQERINELLVQYALKGLRVARLKGGDPFVFGRGGEELEALAVHGIPVTVVPGITAAVGAAAAAAIPLTHRDVAQSVTFTTGHAAEGGAVDWQGLARARHTVVFYMGVAQLERIARELIGAGAPAQRPAALVERATLPEQRVLRAPLAEIAAVARAAQVSSPAVLFVGEVAAEQISAALAPHVRFVA